MTASISSRCHFRLNEITNQTDKGTFHDPVSSLYLRGRGIIY